MRPIAWLSRSIAIVIAGALLVTGVALGVGPRVWRIANAHEQLPVTLPEFQPLSQRSLAYDRAGNVIAVYERENSQPVHLADVPNDVLAAVLAVEDNDYWFHDGVNLRGFTRALLSNFNTDSARQGASTITQQVVKNEFLAGLPRDGRYKVLQAHYAVMLEKQMTKYDILERYLSTVFFGNNAYGIAAAAEVYFGVKVAELDVVQAGFLAGLVRSPSGYDPIRHVEASRFRFKQVMKRFADVGLLSPDEATRLGDNWRLPEVTHGATVLSAAPSYYSAALRDYLLYRTDILGDTEQDRANTLYRGGLRIHTTLDPDLQAKAEQARDLLPDTAQGFDAALVSLEASSGAIRAMVGGRGYVPGTSEVNMALAGRQTGSSIKFFILAAAYEAGAQPNDIIRGEKPCALPSPDGQPFVITDAVSQPEGTLELQTWKSINCAYARLSQIVGLNRVVDTTYRMASSVYLNRSIPPTQRRPIEPYASFATGANEMSPLDMASGMQTVSNDGVHHEPYYVDVIDRVDGERVYTHDDPGVQVLRPEVARTEVATLKGVLTRGTAARELGRFPYPAAGKTGTQDDNTNAWFVGTTRDLVTAVWVGNPDAYTPMRNIPEFTGVPRVQGGTYPARIWGAFMTAAHEGRVVGDWDAPPPNTRAAVRLYLPGNECLARWVTSTPTATTAPATTAAATTAPPTTSGDGGGGETDEPTTTTAPPRVLQRLPVDTTIAPEILDPHAPMPTTGLSTTVYTCGTPPSSL